MLRAHIRLIRSQLHVWLRNGDVWQVGHVAIYIPNHSARNRVNPTYYGHRNSACRWLRDPFARHPHCVTKHETPCARPLFASIPMIRDIGAGETSSSNRYAYVYVNSCYIYLVARSVRHHGAGSPNIEIEIYTCNYRCKSRYIDKDR